MSNPGKYAVSRRRALQMQKELDNIRNRAALERYISQIPPDHVHPSQLSPSPLPNSTPLPNLPTGSHRKLKPLRERPSPKKPQSPGKKHGHRLVTQPDLKRLAISSHHSTSGPATHTQRPCPLVPVSSLTKNKPKSCRKADKRTQPPSEVTRDLSQCVGRREQDAVSADRAMADAVMREAERIQVLRPVRIDGDVGYMECDDQGSQRWESGEPGTTSVADMTCDGLYSRQSEGSQARDVCGSDAGSEQDEVSDSASSLNASPSPLAHSTREQHHMDQRLDYVSSPLSHPSCDQPPSSSPSPSPPPSSTSLLSRSSLRSHTSTPGHTPFTPDIITTSQSAPSIVHTPSTTDDHCRMKQREKEMHRELDMEKDIEMEREIMMEREVELEMQREVEREASVESVTGDMTKEEFGDDGDGVSVPSASDLQSESDVSVGGDMEESGEGTGSTGEGTGSTDVVEYPHRQSGGVIVDGDLKETSGSLLRDMNESVSSAALSETVDGGGGALTGVDHPQMRSSSTCGGLEKNTQSLSDHHSASSAVSEANESPRSQRDQPQSSDLLQAATDTLGDSELTQSDLHTSTEEGDGLEEREKLDHGSSSSSKTITPDIAEFLAFSSAPVTLEDILSLHGTALPLHTPHTPHSPHSTHLPRITLTEGEGRREGGAVYLGTGPLQSSHVTIHHFCTELLVSELPAAVQVAQRNFFSGRSGKTPPAQPHSTSTAESTSDGDGKVTGTVGEKITSSEGQETTTKAQETREKVRETTKKASSEAQETAEEKAKVLVVGISGKRMDIVQDPSNLLWNPVPPKLSLHPHTVTTHLLPHYTHHTASPLPPTHNRCLQPATEHHVWQLNEYITEQKTRGHSRHDYHEENSLPPPLSPRNISTLSPHLTAKMSPKFTLPSSPPHSPTPSHPSSPNPRTTPQGHTYSPSLPPSLSPHSPHHPQTGENKDADSEPCPLKANPLGAMAIREYDIVLEEVSNQREQIMQERMKRRAKTLSSKRRGLTRQASRLHLKRQPSQVHLNRSQSRMDLTSARRDGRSKVLARQGSALNINRGLSRQDSDLNLSRRGLSRQDSDLNVSRRGLSRQDSDLNLSRRGLSRQDSDLNVSRRGLSRQDSDLNLSRRGLSRQDSDLNLSRRGLSRQDSDLNLSRRGLSRQDSDLNLSRRGLSRQDSDVTRRGLQRQGSSMNLARRSLQREDSGVDVKNRVPRQGSAVNLEGSFSQSQGGPSSWKLRRQAIQGRGGGGRKRRSLTLTSSAVLRAREVRETLEVTAGCCRSRRGSHPVPRCDHERGEEEMRRHDYRRSRRSSLPSSPSFSMLMLALGASPTSDPWEWSQWIWWEVWFPEVLYECRRSLSRHYEGTELQSLVGSSTLEGGFDAEVGPVGMRYRRGRRGGLGEGLGTMEEEEGEVIELETAFPCEGDITSWEEEGEYLEEQLEQCEGEEEEEKKAELLSRRATLHRKMGRLKDSAEDVDYSLFLCPSLPSALWTHHLLLLIAGRHSAAQAALVTIVTSPPPAAPLNDLRSEVGHYFLSLIALTRQMKKMNNITAAIIMISRAIAMCPASVECLLERGWLWEEKREGEKAATDYAAVLSLEPLNCKALQKMGDHCLRERQWKRAEEHYSTLLTTNPALTEVRVQRAQALTHMGQHTAALRDLCTCIHLDPSDHRARFWRGCLLRNINPQRALRDLSLALLLPGATAHETASIHLYRAMVYITLKCYPEALSDLSLASSLHPNLLPAHLAAGHLHYTHLYNPHRATRCLSAALRVDPTCQTALLARAEALKSQAKLSEAIRDYSRLIHMYPDLTIAYILRGNLFRESGDFVRAKQHARIVKQLTRNNAPSAVKALVAAFLKDNDEAVAISFSLPPSTSNSILRGKLLTKAGRYSDAVQLLSSVLYNEPSGMNKTDQSQCRVVLGVAYLYAGEIGDVVKVLGDKGEGEGEVPRIFKEMVHLTRGVALLRLGKGREGVADINRALVTNPQSYKAYLIRAAQFAREGRLAKAILNCNEAIALETHSSRAFMYRGVLKYLSGSYRSAVDDLTRSVQLAPSNAHLPLFNRALAYTAIGERDKAVADYTAAAALVPLSPPLSPSSPLALPLLVNRGLLCIDKGDITTALQDFTAALQLTPEDPALLQAIALCHHLSGDLDASLSSYSEALALDPEFLEALVGRGDVYMDQCTSGGRERARDDYCKALEINSCYELARVRLAYLLQAQGSFMAAWNTLSEKREQNETLRVAEGRGKIERGRKGIKRDKPLPSANSGEKGAGLSAALLAARGIISLQMGQLDGAMLDLSRSIRDAPCAETLTNRGVVHCFLGDVPSAMSDYKRALTFDPNYSLAHFNIGNLLLSQRHFHEAIRSYTRALDVAGESGSHSDAVLVNRGVAHMMLGNTERAAADLTMAILQNPYAAHAFFNRAHLRWSQGQLEGAQQDYRRALQLVPEDWLTQYYLGQVCGKLNDRQTSTSLFEQAARAELM